MAVPKIGDRFKAT
ncbi:hypothetical protein TrRE_jg8019, partial [Triparma retinervis]